MTGSDTPPGLRPFAAMISEAKAGNINVRMDLEQFVYLDRDCEAMLKRITAVQTIMDQVSQAQHWGLGEDYRSSDGKVLISGQKVVEWFKTKSKDPSDCESNTASNSVWAVMESHRLAVEDIRTTYREIRKRITDSDTEAAARYKHLEETLPPQPTVKPPEFHAVNLPPQK